MDGNDTSLETIKELFYKQIRDLSVKADSFDMQFSGQLISMR